MPKYAFQIVQKIAGQLNTTMYPQDWSCDPSLAGASRIVICEYTNVETAECQSVLHEQALVRTTPPEIWYQHCPRDFKDSVLRGGTDVIFIGTPTQAMINHSNDIEDMRRMHWNLPHRPS